MSTDNNKLLKTVALFEGSSLLALLFVAMPLKYMAGIPKAVSIVGPVHGVLFLAFLAVLFLCYLKRTISITQLVAGIVASFIPFGSFVYKAKMLTVPNS